MRVRDIVRLVNTYLTGEQLTYQKMLPYLDAAIDEINSRLNSTFPPFSSLVYTSETADALTYSAFPDKYIREVVAPGAAYQFYLIDEEGVDSAPDLGRMYERGLFYMTRDYIEQVPPYYQADSSGSVDIKGPAPEPEGMMICCMRDCMWS